MKQIKTLGLTVLAILALSAAVATAAHAKEGPFWRVEKVRLLEGVKKEISAKAQTPPIKLEATGITIECQALKLAKGSMIAGSEPGDAGTSKEVIEFENCTLIGNGNKCELASPTIVTEPVINTLDYPQKVPAKGDILLVLFTPATGSVFVKIKVKAGAGGTCTVAGELAVEGQVAAEAQDETKKPVKLQEEPAETVTNLVHFPVAGTEACTEKAKAVTCIKPKLTVATKTAKLKGDVGVELTTKEKWGVFGK